MKTRVGKVILVAAAVGLMPLVAVAQNFVRQTGLTNRNTERLTLLTGPDILSPARNTPTMAPQMKLEPAPAVFFVPYGGAIVNPDPSTKVPVFSGGIPVSGSAKRTAPVATPPPRPSPEALRFNQTFEAPAPAFRFQFQPGAKRI